MLLNSTLLDDVKPHLYPKQHEFIKQSIQSTAIPTAKLLIKIHKDLETDGNKTTRLIVPVSSFVSGFSKVGYLDIKQIFDAHEVDYTYKF